MTRTCNATPKQQESSTREDFGLTLMLMAAPETCLSYENDSWYTSDYPIFVAVTNTATTPVDIHFENDRLLRAIQITEAISVGEVFGMGPGDGGPRDPNKQIARTSLTIAPGETWETPILSQPPLWVTTTSVLERTTLRSRKPINIPAGSPRYYQVTIGLNALAIRGEKRLQLDDRLTAEITVFPPLPTDDKAPAN